MVGQQGSSTSLCGSSIGCFLFREVEPRNNIVATSQSNGDTYYLYLNILWYKALCFFVCTSPCFNTVWTSFSLQRNIYPVHVYLHQGQEQLKHMNNPKCVNIYTWYILCYFLRGGMYRTSWLKPTFQPTIWNFLACSGSFFKTFLKISLWTLEVCLPEAPARFKDLQGPCSRTPWNLNSCWQSRDGETLLMVWWKKWIYLQQVFICCFFCVYEISIVQQFVH